MDGLYSYHKEGNMEPRYLTYADFKAGTRYVFWQGGHVYEITRWEGVHREYVNLNTGYMGTIEQPDVLFDAQHID